MARSGARPDLPASLYISYDGLLEPLGQSQILPYVEGLARSGIAFALLTFEKPGDLARRADVERLRERLGSGGIRWVPLRYHKAPSVPATAWDVARGAIVAAWLAWRTPARIVHCRSYVPAVIGLVARAVSGARLIFDMRGFWPEERVEGGLWGPGSAIFRLAKRVEGTLLGASDAVIVLTERARHALGTGAYRAALPPSTPVTVIPCCVDMAKFSAPNVHERAGDTGAPRTLVYAGSVGTWYMLGEMLDFFGAVRARDLGLSFLILNRGGHDVIVRAVEARRLEGVRVVAAAPDEVPDHLSRAYAGIYFIKPVFSKSGASPTKLGEYLAAGLPVVVNAGVGDADQLVASTGVGVVVDRFSADEYVARWDELTAMIARGADFRRHCRETARQTLGLDLGIERYGAVYDSLLAGPAVRARRREEGQLERHATRIP